MRIRIFVLGGIFAFATFLPALAQDTGWAVETYGYTVDRKVSASGDFEYDGIRIETTNSQQPVLRISCTTKHGLTAAIDYSRSSPASTQRSKKSIRPRISKQWLTVEGRKKVHVPWVYLRAQSTIVTRGSKTPAMIFNAAATGKTVSVTLPRNHGSAVISMPPVDEAFEAFVNQCHVTNRSGN